MPLRDHFRPPLDDAMSWDGFHGQWPAMIVMNLSRRLPRGYVAAPHIRLGQSIENDRERGIASSGWFPPEPTLDIKSDLANLDEYDVRIHDNTVGGRLAAVVMIASPANKDRREHRRAFIIKCLALLQARVCVVIVDVVTNHAGNLYRNLLERFDSTDPALIPDLSPIQAVCCRCTKLDGTWALQTWAHPLALGQPLPTLPLWLADNLAIPLELEPSYEDACRALRIPPV